MPETVGYYVYFYYVNDELIYVGRTKTVWARYNAHLREHDLYSQITKIIIYEFLSDADMMLYEKYYITLYHPPLNKADTQWNKPSILLPEPPNKKEYSIQEFKNYYSPTLTSPITDNMGKFPHSIYRRPNVHVLDDNLESYPFLMFTNWDLSTTCFRYRNNTLKFTNFCLEHLIDVADINKAVRSIFYYMHTGLIDLNDTRFTYPIISVECVHGPSDDWLCGRHGGMGETLNPAKIPFNKYTYYQTALNLPYDKTTWDDRSCLSDDGELFMLERLIW